MTDVGFEYFDLVENEVDLVKIIVYVKDEVEFNIEINNKNVSTSSFRNFDLEL